MKEIEEMKRIEEIVNVSSGSPVIEERILSNFPECSFVLNGKRYKSTEGKVQGDKFPPGDPRKYLAYNSSDKEAKQVGNKASIYGYRWIWTADGRKIKYGSPEHYQESGSAIRAKFEQNPQAMRVLLSTKGKKITHELGGEEKPTTCLPKAEFVKILTDLREEKLRELESGGKKYE
jgi:predicted NAD-dependent protein-ADP-ribosyltransferase YbiA (DUF1768 family)